MLVTIAGLGASVDGTWGATLPFLQNLDPHPVPVPGMGDASDLAAGSGSLDDVLAYVEGATHDLGRFDLLGHSLGGSVAIAFALHWPEHVHRLIVAEPNLAPHQGQFSGQIVRWSEQAFVERGFAKIVRALDLAARRGETYPEFATSVAASEPYALHRAATWLRAIDFATMARGLTLPRLFIGGDEADLAEAASLGFETRGMPGTGHVMMREDPEGFATVVRDWLALTEP